MPTTTFDLRDTLIGLYLKEVETITVADGYTPLSLQRRLHRRNQISHPLELNRFILRADDSEWLNDGCSYPEERPHLVTPSHTAVSSG